MLDSELIALLREHNHNAVNFLLQEYGPLMKYIIKPFLSDYREQEECLSDVALQ